MALYSLSSAVVVFVWNSRSWTTATKLQHLLSGFWSSPVQLLPNYNIYCLVFGVLLCNSYQTTTSTVWFLEFSCATATKLQHLLSGFWSYPVQQLPNYNIYCLVFGVILCNSYQTKTSTVWFLEFSCATATKLQHLLSGFWSYPVQQLPNYNIYCLVFGVLMCNCYQVLEEACS